MNSALKEFDDCIARASQAASAFNGAELDALVQAVCKHVEKLEREHTLGSQDLSEVQSKLLAFIKLCEELHATLFDTMKKVLAVAQPPTYAHIAVHRRSTAEHFPYGYLRRYG